MGLERIETLPTLPKRPEDSHKGMYGSVLVLAGGRGMAGAAGLCGAATLRSGAGLVRVACPAEVQPTVASYEPSYMTYPLLNDEEGFVRFEANRARLETLLEQADVLALGPGLGRSEEITRLVRRGIRLIGSFGARVRTDIPALLRLAVRRVIDPARTISRRYTLAQAPQAYDALSRGEIVGRAIVVTE